MEACLAGNARGRSGHMQGSERAVSLQGPLGGAGSGLSVSAQRPSPHGLSPRQQNSVPQAPDFGVAQGLRFAPSQVTLKPDRPGFEFRFCTHGQPGASADLLGSPASSSAEGTVAKGAWPTAGPCPSSAPLVHGGPEAREWRFARGHTTVQWRLGSGPELICPSPSQRRKALPAEVVATSKPVPAALPGRCAHAATSLPEQIFSSLCSLFPFSFLMFL